MGVEAGGLLALMLAIPLAVAAEPQPADESVPPCWLQEDATQRLACYDAYHEENRNDAKAEEGSASGPNKRFAASERGIFSFSGAFMTHRPNYILPFTWVDRPNRIPESPRLGTTVYDYSLDNKEVKYQISFKVPLLTGWMDGDTTFWFGYTQLSFWQLYNTGESAPFRETNFEPELFLRYQADYALGPGTLTTLTLGLNHQSNGQSEPRSRSWNRIMVSASYRYKDWLLMFQPWYRLPESDDEDDNADLERFIGYANYRAIYQWREDHTLSLRLRNNLRTGDNKTSAELSYSFPLGDTLKAVFQYHNGYAESLADYNHRSHRFGVGIMFNDWL